MRLYLEGLDNFSDIVDKSDGVMVGPGRQAPPGAAAPFSPHPDCLLIVCSPVVRPGGGCGECERVRVHRCTGTLQADRQGASGWP